jgi:hypothetical protein
MLRRCIWSETSEAEVGSDRLVGQRSATDVPTDTHDPTILVLNANLKTIKLKCGCRCGSKICIRTTLVQEFTTFEHSITTFYFTGYSINHKTERVEYAMLQPSKKANHF